jgi:chromate transporter
VLFAFGANAIAQTVAGQGLISGLKLVAVAIVAQAVWGMARTLCPDRPRASIAAACAVWVLLAPPSIGQISAIAAGIVLGLVFCRGDTEMVPEPLAFAISKGVAAAALALFAVLLAVSFWPFGDRPLGMFSAFYRSGALVFGGGHVVLPLLADAVAGWIGAPAFLAGYGAAQAVPGPLFTFAAYLGATATMPVHGVPGAALALVAIFLPGLLLQLGVLPYWNLLRGRKAVQAAMRGVNAAVVGVLGAAFYTPVWASAVMNGRDLAIALTAFILLVVWKLRPVLVVAFCGLAGILLATLS